MTWSSLMPVPCRYHCIDRHTLRGKSLLGESKETAAAKPIGPCSKQRDKLFFRKASLANQSAQCAFGQFPMIRHAKTTHSWMPQDQVAAGLMIQLVSELPKRAH